MKNLLLGINGLSYSNFMECNPRFLFSLFGATYRGVVTNTHSLHPSPSWLSVLEMKDVDGNGFIKNLEDKPKLVQSTEAELVNVPVTDPSYGAVSVHYDASVSEDDEIRNVEKTVLNLLETHNVIASINAIDRIMSSGGRNICELYTKIDIAVRTMTTNAENFIVFSPFGGISKNCTYIRETHGVYMGTIDRPSEYDTLSPKDVGILFERLVSGN